MDEIPEVSTFVKPTTPLWVAMPNFVLRRPPIAHRGNSDEGRLTPACAKQRHRASLAGGRSGQIGKVVFLLA
jgi:hypothetical protein